MGAYTCTCADPGGVGEKGITMFAVEDGRCRPNLVTLRCKFDKIY